MAMRVSTASDTFWHLRAGEWILEHGRILREDPFSLTRFGQVWRYPGWLSQVLMISVFKAFGYPGLNIFTAFFVLLGFIFVFFTLEGRDAIRIVVLLLAAVSSAVYWSARPHIITFCLTGLFLWILEDYRRGRRNLVWLLPLGMALWGNFHGGFASGFVLIFCYLTGEIIEALIPVIRGESNVRAALLPHQRSIVQYMGVGLVSAVTLSLNPHGPRMLLYPFMTVEIESLRDYIQEWQSPNFHDPQVYPFIALMILLTLSFALTKKKISAHEFVLSTVFLVLALTAARNIALYTLISAPILSRHLSSGLGPILGRVRSKQEFKPELARRLNLLLLSLCVIAAGIKISIPLDPQVNRDALQKIYPYGAIRFLRGFEPQGALFNSYNWGSIILWELYPDYKTFVDGRTDLFNDEILKEYLATWRGEPEWIEVFKRWDIGVVLIENHAPLRYLLEKSDWIPIYEDDQSVILVP